MARDESAMWPYIRSLRSGPLRYASGQSRKRDFTASLEQAEQLFRAADSVGAETSPILLFYGIGQLGRAMCAAFADGPAYAKLNSHGLKPSDSGKGVFQSKLTVHEVGLFPAVAKLLGCPPINRPLTLPELFATIPEVRDFMLTSFPYEYQPVRLEPDRFVLMARDKFINGKPVAKAFVSCPVDIKQADDPRAKCAEFLSHYPALAGAIIPDSDEFLNDPEGISVGWLWETDTPNDISDWPQRVASVEARRTAYGFEGGKFVFPALNDIGVVPPFLVWWLILFSLSTHARYYPGVWLQDMNVDRTDLAVLTEALLKAAPRRVPDLVLRAYHDVHEKLDAASGSTA